MGAGRAKSAPPSPSILEVSESGSASGGSAFSAGLYDAITDPSDREDESFNSVSTQDKAPVAPLITTAWEMLKIVRL